ncbi:MAG: methyltransferase domain-containing protein [Gemmataceae bacterium]
MNCFISGVARAITETFSLPEPILEIGSYQVPEQPGQNELINLRPLFEGKEYTGVDIRPGPGVDVVASVESLPQADESVGTVIALNTFEHVTHFWRGFEEIHRVLRPDGALVISVPFYFHIHNHPNDYWRFTPDAVKVLLEPYSAKILGYHGPRKKPLNIWALAFKGDAHPLNPDTFAKYENLVRSYAREPLPAGKKFKYLLGRVLCGSRPFLPYLQRDAWETECLA